MSILGKSLPAANVDALLYAVPAATQAAFTVNACNISGVDASVRIAALAMADLALASANVTTPGSGFTSIPSVTVTGENTSAASAQVSTLAVTAFTINAAGSGYTPNDVLTLAGGTFNTAATIRVLTTAANSGIITSAVLINGGSYTALHASNAATTTGGTGTGASAQSISYGVTGLSVTSGGNGYKAAPAITLTGGGPGTGFAATSVMTTAIEASDYVEFNVVLPPGGVLERTGFFFGPNESVFVRSSVAGAVAFHAWGLPESA